MCGSAYDNISRKIKVDYLWVLGNQFPHNTSTAYEREREKEDQMQSNPGPGDNNKNVGGAQIVVCIKST